MNVPTGMFAIGSDVTGLDIRFGTGIYLVAVFESHRSDDVFLRSVLILKKRDVSGSIRIVFDADNRRGLVRISALEIDDSVFLFVAAALVTDGDSAVAVSAGMFFLDLNKTLFGENFVISAKSGTDILRLAGVVGLYLIVAILFPPPYQIMPSKNSMDFESALSVTMAFFQAFV